MGTRNLTCVFVNGEYKVAQYGQWDGYPEGQGSTILKFLQSYNKETFLKNLNTTRFIEEDEYNKLWLEVGVDIKASNGMVNMDDSDKFKKKHPQLDRDMGGGVLKFIENNENVVLNNEINFVYDGLFCEWCYVVDFDKNVLEVYRGFNKEILDKTERFFTKEASDNGYTPVTMLISFDLDKLPSEEDFVKQIRDKDEDDE